MRKVFICSPFGEYSAHGLLYTTRYNASLAKVLCKNALDGGYAPFAPHLIYPTILNDTVEADRELGIAAGISFLKSCDELWFFQREYKGISAGMREELLFAIDNKVDIYEFRRDTTGQFVRHGISSEAVLGLLNVRPEL